MTQTQDNVFGVRRIELAGTTEDVVVGGRDRFDLLPQAFEGVTQIAVLGWSSQGPAQAQNLRESLAGRGIRVVVGLRKNSSSFAKAAECGFTVDDGTAGDMFDVASASDLVIALINDAAQSKLVDSIQRSMKAGATLGFSHGFVLGYMKIVGMKFRDDINVVAVCPKGMGPSVRALYVQGKSVNGAGINASYAIQQDVTGRARNIALGWAIAIGSPYVFETTLEKEYLSDISGERNILLGGVWATAEAMNDYYIGKQMLPHEAFARSAMAITGPISKIISEKGLLGILEAIPVANRAEFLRTVYLSYRHSLPIVTEIYNEVKSGREIGSVIDQTNAIERFGWTKVDGTQMWRTGETARKGNVEVPLDARTSGSYIGMMLAQVEVLRENGHCWSEIVNETIIEATDSLNPYMHVRGIDYLIDNCSVTARLGGRKWGPVLRQMVIGDVMPKVDDAQMPHDFEQWFLNHPVHDAHRVCSEFKPPVSIYVQ